jgi:small subunit ribosomal protein S17
MADESSAAKPGSKKVAEQQSAQGKPAAQARPIAQPVPVKPAAQAQPVQPKPAAQAKPAAQPIHAKPAAQAQPPQAKPAAQAQPAQPKPVAQSQPAGQPAPPKPAVQPSQASSPTAKPAPAKKKAKAPMPVMAPRAMKGASHARNIGIDVPLPTGGCDDEDCPFHGTLPVRGVILEGVVVSDKMNKTVVVRREYMHFVDKYERIEKRTSKHRAHSPPCLGVKAGDMVTIMECRPLSKTVSFVVVERKK